MKQVIIFDLDGTLLNTLYDLYLSFNYAIGRFGYPKRTLEEIKSFVGNGVKRALELSLPEKIDDNKMSEILNVFKEYYTEHMYNNTKAYEGIVEMLEKLKKKGYVLAVLSNKYDKAVKGLCKKYFGDLIEISFGEGNGIRKKPYSDGVFKILDDINMSESHDDKTVFPDKVNVIYIGDSEVDIQTAKNAGIYCISVLWGFKSREFLEQNGGKVYAEKPDDIIKIIEKKLYLF